MGFLSNILTLVYVNLSKSSNRKKWRSPPPDSRIFDSLPKALRYAEASNIYPVDPRSLRRFKLNLDSEPEWCCRDTNSDENTSLMTDAEVIVRILEARIRLDMTLMFDPTGEWYSKSTHIHHIPQSVLSRAARFVRFVKRLRSDSAKKKKPKTAPTDSSSQLVVCKMASAFLYSICLMFKIDIKSKMKSWKKIMSLLTPFDAPSGTVSLDAYVMKFSAKQSNLLKSNKMPAGGPVSRIKVKSEHLIRANVGPNTRPLQTDFGKECTNHVPFKGESNAVYSSKPGVSFSATNNDILPFTGHSVREQSLPTNRGWLLDKNDNDMNAANALITLAGPSQLVQNKSNDRQNKISEVGNPSSDSSVHVHSAVEGLERPHDSVRLLLPSLDKSGKRFEGEQTVTTSNTLSKNELVDNSLAQSMTCLKSPFRGTIIGSHDVIITSDHIDSRCKVSNIPVRQNDKSSISFVNSMSSGPRTSKGGVDDRILTPAASTSDTTMKQVALGKVEDKDCTLVKLVTASDNETSLPNDYSTSIELGNGIAPVLNQSSKCNLENGATDTSAALDADVVIPPGSEDKFSLDSPLKSEIDLPWFAHPFQKVYPVRGWNNTRSCNGFKEETWFDPRTCCLCNIQGDDDAGIDIVDSDNSDKYKVINGSGRLLPLPSGGWVHCGCATWSSEVWETPSGGILRGVGKARGRGGKLRCFGCGQYGATLGCHRSACNANFHFPCAKACGATFTLSHKLYCECHKQFAKDEVVENFSEPMKILRVEEDDTNIQSHLCYRSGSLVIHSLGKIDEDRDGFHSKSYITPSGFTSSRIFWSFSQPKTRTVYIMRIVQSKDNVANFIASAADAPTVIFEGGDVNTLYNDIVDRVLNVNKDFFSHGDLLSVFPMERSKKNKTGFCLNGPQVSSDMAFTS